MTSYSKPNWPARRQNCLVPSMELSPPSRYFQTARPDFTQSVLGPCGKNFGSGGGQRLGTISLFTSVFKSAPIITTRQGVVMVPQIAAGCETRATSSLV